MSLQVLHFCRASSVRLLSLGFYDSNCDHSWVDVSTKTLAADGGNVLVACEEGGGEDQFAGEHALEAAGIGGVEVFEDAVAVVLAEQGVEETPSDSGIL